MFRKRLIREEAKKRWPEGEQLPTFDDETNKSELKKFCSQLQKKDLMGDFEKGELEEKVLKHMQGRRKYTKKKLELVNIMYYFWGVRVALAFCETIRTL